MKHKSLLTDTEDMNLAVTLSALGYELVDLDKRSYSGRVTFRFKQADGLDESAQRFWSGKLQVDAKTLLNEFKNIKARLRSQTD